MTNVHVSWEDTIDPLPCSTNSSVYEEYSRDPVRTPFQWDDSLNAGFSTAVRPWLPIALDYRTVNAKAQWEADRSHLKVFKKLNELRELAALNYGSYEPMVVDESVLVYRRFVMIFITVLIY